MFLQSRAFFPVALTFLVVNFAGPAQAADLCVNPGDGSCYPTVQEAVDEAESGDVITIHPKADGTAYNEGVVVRTPGLTLTGAVPGAFDKILNRPEFGGTKAALTLKDTDAKLWIKNYTNGSQLKKDIKTLAKVTRQKVFLTTCPGVIVESCKTMTCSRRGDRPYESAIHIEANDTTVSDLTLRHGRYGVALSPGVTGTTIRNSCFRANSRPIASSAPSGAENDSGSNEEGGNDNTTVKSVALFNASNEDGIFIKGDDARVEENLLITTDGIDVEGARGVVTRNAMAGTNDYKCIEIDGPDGVISYNILLNCEGAISGRSANDTLVEANLILGQNRSREMIRIGMADSQPSRRTIIRHNILRLGTDSGIYLQTSGATVEGNLVESTGNNINDAGIEIFGNNNLITGNLIRNTSWAGIRIRGQTYFLDEGFPPGSSDNQIRNNRILGNGTGGVVLAAAQEVATLDAPAPGVRGTIIADNLIAGNHGEGVAIVSNLDERDACPTSCSYDSDREEWELSVNSNWSSCNYWTAEDFNESSGVCTVTTDGFTEQDCTDLGSGSWDAGAETCSFELPNQGEPRCVWLGGTWDAAASFCTYTEAAINTGLAALSPSATSLEGNTIVNNRTDVCNESSSTVIADSNSIGTGGIDTTCIVQPRDN